MSTPDHQCDAIIEKLGSAKGTYLLLFQRAQADDYRLVVGRIGEVVLRPGFYIYVGSAFGPGGVRARVRHHLKIQSRTHWHLDYIRPHLTLHAFGFHLLKRELECQWAQALQTLPGRQALLEGLGSSDCQCETHLAYFSSDVGLIDLEQQLTRKLKHIQLHTLR